MFELENEDFLQSESLDLQDKAPLKIRETQHGIYEYRTSCTVETNIPVTPDDELRYLTRKNGVSVQAYIDDTWIRIGSIQNWHKTDGEVTLQCIKPHPYELPIRVIIKENKNKTQLSLFDTF